MTGQMRLQEALIPVYRDAAKMSCNEQCTDVGASVEFRACSEFAIEVREQAESPTAKQAAEKKERDFSQRPPELVVTGVYDWVCGLDVHSRTRGSVYDKAGPKSFEVGIRLIQVATICCGLALAFLDVGWTIRS